MDYEQLVEKCKQLRATHERAEAEFFVFLIVVEREHQEVWAGAGCATFEQFLRSNQLCKPERYAVFVRGVNRVGVDDALANGAAWTIEAGKFEDPTPEVLQQFKERATAFLEVRHVAPAEETSREWRSQLDQSSKTHTTIQKASELHRLRAENQKLRAELKAAQSTITDLKSQIEKKGVKRGKAA